MLNKMKEKNLISAVIRLEAFFGIQNLLTQILNLDTKKES